METTAYRYSVNADLPNVQDKVRNIQYFMRVAFRCQPFRGLSFVSSKEREYYLDKRQSFKVCPKIISSVNFLTLVRVLDLTISKDIYRRVEQF